MVYAVLLIFFGTISWLAYAVFALDQTAIYAENAVLESLQVLALIISAMVFLYALKHSKREGKLFLLFLSFLCLSFILREVDVEDFDLPSFLIAIGSGTGRNLILGIGFIGMEIYAAFNFAYYKEAVKAFFRSKAGLLILAAGVLLYLGDLFENLKTVHHHVFWEETIELSGYMAMLLSALMLLKEPNTESSES